MRIEAYDVAHISGTAQVGVMVVIADSEPDKSAYRKFKIKTVRGADVLQRAWPRCLSGVSGIQNGNTRGLSLWTAGRRKNRAERVLEKWGLIFPLCR